MPAKTDWPYDARRDDPLTRLRIPVTTSYPGWRYLVAFDGVPIHDGDLMERPDERETAILASYIEYTRVHWFGDGHYAQRLLQRPFDIDGGHNTLILRKWGEGDWAHRRDSWRSGPAFVPEHPRFRSGATPPLGLVALLDDIHTYGGKEPLKDSVEWKDARPEVFGD